MDITFFTPRTYPAIAGGEFYILNLATNLKKFHNDNVDLWCSNSIDFKGLSSPDGRILNPNHENYYSYLGIPIKRFEIDYKNLTDDKNLSEITKETIDLVNLVGLNLSRETITKFLKNGPNLNHHIAKLIQNKSNFSDDIIHSTYIPYANILYSLIIAQSLQKPSVCTPFFHMFNPRYNFKGYSTVLTKFDGIIACTQVEKRFLIKQGLLPDKIRVIPMGVDFNLYNNPVKSQTGKLKSFKKEFGIKSPFVLFCGYKNHEKGSISLLKSTSLISKSVKNIFFVFIGPSTKAFDIELKKIRKKQIRVLNLTPQSMTGYYDWRKISAYQECSVFAMPSRSDAYGMAYLEAWAAGKPVIGINNPVMKEVISNGKNGILVDFDNFQQIADAIIHLLDDKEYARRLGMYGAKKVKKNNSWQEITKNTREFYKTLIL